VEVTDAPRPVYPPVFFLAALLAMAGLHFFLPERRWLSPPATYAGGLLILVGIILLVVSSRLFERSGTTIKPFEESTTLVVDGPFRLSRHPMYLGMVVVLLGCASLLGTVWPPLVIPVFIVLITRRFIVREEQMMEQVFGDEYRAYCRQTRRWI
jgi:protein-S-isoprenylcysteine O-methyltransferase Ste14